MVFYECRKIILFKLVGSIIYSLNKFTICTDYLCLHQETISQQDAGFEDTCLDFFSGIGIPNLLVNIMSSHGLSIRQCYEVVLSCFSELFPIICQKDFLLQNIIIRKPVSGKKCHSKWRNSLMWLTSIRMIPLFNAVYHFHFKSKL